MPAFIPGNLVSSWNNPPSIRFSVVMFNRQSRSAASLESPDVRKAEALHIAPSIASRSAAFEDLALPLFPALYNHAFWLVRNKVEAEDLVQEALTKALSAFDSFKPSTNFKAWIFRILRNTFFTSRTCIAASRTIFIEDNPDVLHSHDAAPTPEETLIRQDSQSAIVTALGQLQPQLREALLLCDVEEMKYKDIALILDVPIGTVMSRISRARQALRQLIHPEYGV